MSGKSKSPQVQSAISDVLEAVELNSFCQYKVAKVFRMAM